MRRALALWGPCVCLQDGAGGMEEVGGRRRAGPVSLPRVSRVGTQPPWSTGCSGAQRPRVTVSGVE